MKRRGHGVGETAAVVIQGAFGHRAEPPPELLARQQEIWRAIVASEPIDFFGTAALRNMLMDLCRHREAAEKISAVIDSFDAAWLRTEDGSKRYHDLLKMRELEVRSASSLATRLRLTNQSRYTPQAASSNSRNAVKGYKPWEKPGPAS
jgi:hypothetical protein